MLCPNLMLEPTYLPYFSGMKKETHMFHLGLSLIEIIKNDKYNDTSNHMMVIRIAKNVKA